MTDTTPTEREQLLVDASCFANEIARKMYETTDKDEFNRLDKVAMRLTNFIGSLARYRRPGEFQTLANSPTTDQESDSLAQPPRAA